MLIFRPFQKSPILLLKQKMKGPLTIFAKQYLETTDSNTLVFQCNLCPHAP